MCWRRPRSGHGSAWIYASQHPEKVAGLVLIDPTPVDLEARWKACLPQAQRSLERRLRERQPRGDRLRGERDPAGCGQSAAGRPTAGAGPGQGDQIPSAWPIEQLDPSGRNWWPRRRKRCRSGRLIVAENSSHGMVFETPDPVIDAVLQVVEAVRDPSSWAASATPEEGTPTP